MKKIYLIVCVLFAVLLVFGCGAQEAPETSAQTKNNNSETEELPASLWNNTEIVFTQISIKSSIAEEWADELAKSITLNPSESYGLWLGKDEKDLYDIEIIDENEDIWSLLEVPLAPGSEILVFDEQTAWTVGMDGEEADIEVIFTNTENEEDYALETSEATATSQEENSLAGTWELLGQMDTEPTGEIEFLEGGTLITHPKGNAAFESTYSIDGDAVIMHFDGFDLELQLDGDTLATPSGSPYAVRK